MLFDTRTFSIQRTDPPGLLRLRNTLHEVLLTTHVRPIHILFVMLILIIPLSFLPQPHNGLSPAFATLKHHVEQYVSNTETSQGLQVAVTIATNSAYWESPT